MSIEKEFSKMVSDAGLPSNEAQAATMWQSAASEANSPFNNSSEYSPFWRAILKLVTTPLLWLVNDLLVKQVLPNMFVKTANGYFLSILGWAVDCEIKPAATARGLLTFARVLTAGEVEIPLGTIVQSPAINGKIYSLRTTAPAAMIDGQGTIVVSAEALGTGEAYNLAPYYYSVMPQPVPGISSVTNLENWLLEPGADEEAPDDYRLRIRNQFTAVNQYHTDAVYRKIITQFAGINTRNVFFEHGAPRGPGTANAYILLDVGEPGEILLNAIAQHVMGDGNHGHGDDLAIFAMPGVGIELTVTIIPESYLSDDEKQELAAQVEQAVRCAFRENAAFDVVKTEPFAVFSMSKLGGELHALFTDLESVRFSLADIETGMNVPRLDNLTVVIND